MTTDGDPPIESPADTNPFSSPVETPPEPQRGLSVPMGILIAFVSLASGVVAFGCSCYPLAVATVSVADENGFFLALGGSVIISFAVIFFVARALVRSERKARASKVAARRQRD